MTEHDTRRLCKDCTYASKDIMGRWRCIRKRHKYTIVDNFVEGRCIERNGLIFCVIERFNDSTGCGEVGRYWKRRPTFKETMIQFFQWLTGKKYHV